jgi:hypothetical protein
MGPMNGKGKLSTYNEIYIDDFKSGLYEGEGKLIIGKEIIEGKFYKGQKV